MLQLLNYKDTLTVTGGCYFPHSEMYSPSDYQINLILNLLDKNIPSWMLCGIYSALS